MLFSIYAYKQIHIGNTAQKQLSTPFRKNPVWKRSVSKQTIFKRHVSHVLNITGWMKLNVDTVDLCNFVVNEFNPNTEVQNIENRVFQNAPLVIPPLQMPVFQMGITVTSGLQQRK